MESAFFVSLLCWVVVRVAVMQALVATRAGEASWGPERAPRVAPAATPQVGRAAVRMVGTAVAARAALVVLPLAASVLVDPAALALLAALADWAERGRAVVWGEAGASVV